MMRNFFLILASVVTLSACVPMAQQAPLPAQSPTNSPQQAVLNLREVIDRVEPVAEQVCREETPDQLCDFAIYVDSAPESGVNAFYTIDDKGQPAIIFTIGLIAVAANTDELAFIMGHEAGHHIGRHLPRVQASADLGAQILTQIARAGGVSEAALGGVAQVGAVVASRQYGRQAELEADAIGTIIALRAGFDPLRGAAFFERIPDPARSFLATHPPNEQRIDTVRRTLAGQVGQGS
ncbi:M48 family metallopeptidase [Roseicyclus sp.]|uniref:M48 family metallopeptidase n=1 Tax=Roseicyclus sp. TaxID=1914329 RepID=UPI003F6C46BB